MDHLGPTCMKHSLLQAPNTWSEYFPHQTPAFRTRNRLMRWTHYTNTWKCLPHVYFVHMNWNEADSVHLKSEYMHPSCCKKNELGYCTAFCAGTKITSQGHMMQNIICALCKLRTGVWGGKKKKHIEELQSLNSPRCRALPNSIWWKNMSYLLTY